MDIKEFLAKSIREIDRTFELIVPVWVNQEVSDKIMQSDVFMISLFAIRGSTKDETTLKVKVNNGL